MFKETQLVPQTPVEIWTIYTVSIGIFIVLIGIGIAGTYKMSSKPIFAGCGIVVQF